MLTRRNFMATLAGAAAGAFVPALGRAASRRDSRLDRLVPLIDPYLSITHGNTGETVRTRFYTITGYDMHAVAQLNELMRDWREKEVVQMDVRLFWGLAAVRQAAMKDGHSGEITLFSGYRTPKTNALLREQGYKTAVNSYHMKGMANDFILEGAKLSDLANYVQWLQVGGRGYYPRSGFVHMDSGPERQWNET